MSSTVFNFRFTHLRQCHLLKTLHQVVHIRQSLSTNLGDEKLVLNHSSGPCWWRNKHLDENVKKKFKNLSYDKSGLQTKGTAIEHPVLRINTVWPNHQQKTNPSAVQMYSGMFNEVFERSLFGYIPNRNYSTGINELSVHSNPLYRDYLISLVEEQNNIMTDMAGDTVNLSVKNRTLRLQELSDVVSHFKQIEKKLSEVTELDGLISGSNDSEIVTMATQEKTQLLEELDEKEQELVLLLAGESRVDHNDIVLELTAGVGGQEAMLFTGEMFDMYKGYAAYKGWNFNTLNYESSDTGGLRHVSAAVTGTDVFKHLKFEGGVHRVQRVPKTERSGRIHTSTMTVAVLPQPQDIDVVISPKDLQIETFRASGKGGQHVNTTDSAVRITHLPTKTVAECQVQRSQIQNKELALQILKSRLYEAELRSQTEQVQLSRKLQTGSGGRSEKIRTYNFPQDRITDHRLGANFHNLDVFMTGGQDLEDLIQGMLWKVKCDVVEDMVEEFAKQRKAKKA